MAAEYVKLKQGNRGYKMPITIDKIRRECQKGEKCRYLNDNDLDDYPDYKDSAKGGFVVFNEENFLFHFFGENYSINQKKKRTRELMSREGFKRIVSRINGQLLYLR